jgi:hypothetical protein
MGVSPVRWVVVGVNAASCHSTFLPFVHDTLPAWWGMFYGHSLIPYVGLV